MSIYELGPSLFGPNGPGRVREKEDSAKKEAASESSQEARGDRVEISNEGRALSSQAGISEATISTLTAERLEEIQQRIDSGTYDTPDMAEEVARRLLISGDL